MNGEITIMKNKVDISFLIPTNRPHDQYLNRTIDAIKNMDSLGLSFEILVSTTSTYHDYDNVKFFLDEENKGSVKPINFLAEQSNGDVICVLVDDYLPSDNLFTIKEFLNSDTFSDRKYKICSLAITTRHGQLPPELVPTGVANPITGEFLPHDRFYIVKFPVMDRNTYNLLGKKIFHPHFIHHAADNYLAIYLGFIGEPTIECSSITLNDWSGRNSETKYDLHETLVLFDLIKNLNYNYYNHNEIINSIDELEFFYLNKNK